MNARNHLKQFVIALLLACVQASETSLTVYVGAGKIECFFETVRLGQTIHIEYQVIDGGKGDLDISFSLHDPTGSLLATDYKKLQNIHHYEQVKKEGDYRLCFDNTFSTFNRKTVFFELLVEQSILLSSLTEPGSLFKDFVDKNAIEKTHMGTMLGYVDRIQLQITKAQQLLGILRSMEARDRSLAEANFTKVNKWSFFQICAMIFVGCLQIFMVRSIFEPEARVTRFWNNLGI